jgi:hypothetical protein
VSSFWSGLFGRDQPAAPPQQPAPQQVPPQAAEQAPPAGDPIEELERQLTELVRRVNRAGGTMPEGGVPAVREVEDVLRPLLRYLRSNPPTAEEMIPVRATVTDYLPSTVNAFLALPPDFAVTHRNRMGRTPAEELLEQLRLLAEGAQEYATAIYAGDAQELTNQGRFLATKFTRSDLDL